MASEAQLQLRAQRAAQREAGNYKPIEYSPPAPQKPQLFGRDIELNDEVLREKSILGRVANDASLLAYGVPTAVAQIGTGLFTDPIGTAKLVGGGLVQTGKDILGATGVLGGEQQRESINYYKAHPLMGALDAFGVAGLGAGAVVKSALTTTARSATEVAVRAALKAGVKQELIDSALWTTRSAFNPKAWFGATRKVANPFFSSLEKVVRTGNVDDVAETVAKQFVKQGVEESVALQIARETADDVAKSVVRHGTKLKVGESIWHPVSAISRGVRAPASAVGRALFGTPEGTAVAKIFGKAVVDANRKTAIGLEKWLEAVVHEQGLENTVENRVRTLMDWKRQSDFANLTPAQLFKDFENYVQADVKVRNLREITGSQFVPVKVISKETADSMIANVRENIDTIRGEVAAQFPKADAVTQTAKVFEKIQELLTDIHGRDFEKYAEQLQKAYGAKGSIDNLEKAIAQLSAKRSSVSFEKWSPEAQTIARDMENTGYRIGVAPTGKEVSFASDIIEKSRAVSERAEELTRKNGGVTIRLDGDIPDGGFMVAPSKKTEFKVAMAQLTKKAIDDYIAANLEALNKPNAHLGMWVDDAGNVVIDVSEVYDDVRDATRVAIKGEQDAVFNLNNFESIYAKDYQKVISDDSFYRKIQGTDKRGAVGATGAEGGAGARAGGEARRKGVTESDFDTQRTFLGKALDRFGLSTKGVVEGSNEFLFGQNFLQHTIKDIGEKFGTTLKIKRPVAVTTEGGRVLQKTRTVTLPVDKLYEYLRNNRNEIFKERIGLGGAEAFRPISVFDINKTDLVKFGFADDVAEAIDKISRKSLRETPASVIGMGEKLVNLMRGSNRDFGLFGRHYDNFLKASFYMRYQSPAAFLFQAQQYLETKLMAAMITKNPKFIPGAEMLTNFGKRLIPGKINQRLGEVKSALQKITEEPALNELVIARDDILPNTQRALEDVLSSPEFARERIGISQAAKKVETASDIMSRGKMEGLWIRAMGGWTMNVAAKIGKSIAAKFNMTLEEAAESVTRDGVKVYRNPKIMREIQDAVQQTIHYKRGFQTSPLVKTLNVAWFPFRFQAKTLAVTAKWLGELSPPMRLAVLNNWVNFANWASTDEGLEWRRKHQNLLYSLLAYTTAWEQIGDSLDAVGRGELFGGNTGLIGGVPLGFVSNTLQNLAVLPEDPQQIDPKTGQPFRFRKAPRELLSDVALMEALEEYIFTMLPGMPLYTITGGVVKGASYRHLFENILESGYGWARAKALDQSPERSKELLEREYMRLPFESTRF